MMMMMMKPVIQSWAGVFYIPRGYRPSDTFSRRFSERSRPVFGHKEPVLLRQRLFGVNLRLRKAGISRLFQRLNADTAAAASVRHSLSLFIAGRNCFWIGAPRSSPFHPFTDYSWLCGRERPSLLGDKTIGVLCVCVYVCVGTIEASLETGDGSISVLPLCRWMGTRGRGDNSPTSCAHQTILYFSIFLLLADPSDFHHLIGCWNWGNDCYLMAHRNDRALSCCLSMMSCRKFTVCCTKSHPSSNNQWEKWSDGNLTISFDFFFSSSFHSSGKKQTNNGRLKEGQKGLAKSLTTSLIRLILFSALCRSWFILIIYFDIFIFQYFPFSSGWAEDTHGQRIIHHFPLLFCQLFWESGFDKMCCFRPGCRHPFKFSLSESDWLDVADKSEEDGTSLSLPYAISPSSQSPKLCLNNRRRQETFALRFDSFDGHVQCMAGCVQSIFFFEMKHFTEFRYL